MAVVSKTALVTGGSGFLGSHLCDFLIEKDINVVCMDNLITGRKANIKHLEHHPSFTFINHNISTHIDYAGTIDYVLHFASPASPDDYIRYPIQTLKVGALGTHNCLGFAKAKGAVFLLASTSEVYGDPLQSPQSETYWGNVNPVGPRGVYDEAKRFAEAITMAYHRTHRMNTKIVRIFNTYGPRMRLNDGRVVPAFIGQALKKEALSIYGDGKQTRSFCYVSDTVAGIFRLLLSDVNDPVNVGNPNEMTILELAKTLCHVAHVSCEYAYKELPEDDPKVRKPDISKANRLLGWKPLVRLEDGLAQTLEWFQAHDRN